MEISPWMVVKAMKVNEITQGEDAEEEEWAKTGSRGTQHLRGDDRKTTDELQRGRGVRWIWKGWHHQTRGVEGFVMESETTDSGATTMANPAREGLESIHWLCWCESRWHPRVQARRGVRSAWEVRKWYEHVCMGRGWPSTWLCHRTVGWGGRWSGGQQSSSKSYMRPLDWKPLERLESFIFFLIQQIFIA